MSLLDRLRSLPRDSSRPEGPPGAEEQRLDAMPAAALHNANPVHPGAGLPPPGYVRDDEGRFRA